MKERYNANQILSEEEFVEIVTQHKFEANHIRDNRSCYKDNIHIWWSCFGSPKWIRAELKGGQYIKHTAHDNLIDAMEIKERIRVLVLDNEIAIGEDEIIDRGNVALDCLGKTNKRVSDKEEALKYIQEYYKITSYYEFDTEKEMNIYLQGFKDGFNADRWN